MLVPEKSNISGSVLIVLPHGNGATHRREIFMIEERNEIVFVFGVALIAWKNYVLMQWVYIPLNREFLLVLDVVI